MRLTKQMNRLTRILIPVIALVWLMITGIFLFSSSDPRWKVAASSEPTTSMLTLTELHFQGNIEEGCTGDGAADITGCGGPFLLSDPVLSTNPAASWTIANPALNGTGPRTIYDPSWIWNLTSPVRLGGPMTIDWWASCGGCGGALSADWNIRVWADGVKAYEQRIEATPTLPNVPSLLSKTIFLPEINASSNIVLHIDPVYIDGQNNTKIYYDSQSTCQAGGPAPCDSKVIMPVLAPGEIVPTPTPITTGTLVPSACAVPTFDNYTPPVGYPRREVSGEPSIGVNWNTGNVMTMSRLRGNRTTFDDSTSPADPLTTSWFSQTSPAIVTGFDPILFTDSITGRTIGGELEVVGGTTNGFISDDDLATISATFQTGGPTQGIDHQTIGGGPPNPNVVGRQPTTAYPNLFYYASQASAAATVATSFDGGLTYQPAVPAYNLLQCGGLHGHIKVAPDGTVYLPNKGCTGKSGMAVSTDNGLTWEVRVVPDSTEGETDPSVGIGAGGRVYFAYTDSNNRPFVSVSDDSGQTWGISLNLGQGVTPAITAAVFPHAVAGDNDRAAVFFLGTNSTDTLDPVGDDNGGAGPNYAGTWYPYVAITCDGGKSWSVTKADNNPLDPGAPNPVQQGVICTGGTLCPEGPPDTRNLLDFNEMTVDARGRILTVYADGCGIEHPCHNINDNSGTRVQNQGIARLTIIRQRGGMRLFSSFEPEGPAPPSLSPPVQIKQEKTGFALKWATPDDNGSPILRYRIYRGSTKGKDKLISEVKPNQNTYFDKQSIKNKSNIYYKVTAVNKYGESPRNVRFSAKN